MSTATLVSAAPALKRSFKFASDDGVAAVDCAGKGGTMVTTSDAAVMICNLPLAATSLKFQPDDAVADADCKATGGVVTTGSDGNKLCTKATPAQAPTREPHN